MKILLDTHILLWWLANAPQLSAETRARLADPENSIFVSAVSLWEIRLKQSLGKLHLPDDFDSRLANEAFESLPLMAAHTNELTNLPWHHRDPFDRMLLAQARAAGLQFLTADATMVAYGDGVVLAR